jgi:hypothetical protein
LNELHDRFYNVAEWYIVTRRITVGSQNAKFDRPAQ